MIIIINDFYDLVAVNIFRYLEEDLHESCFWNQICNQSQLKRDRCCNLSFSTKICISSKFNLKLYLPNTLPLEFSFSPTFDRFSIIFFFLFHLSIFPQITADIHLIFVFGSHLGFFFLVTGILLRFIFGPLPFFLVFFLVQVLPLNGWAEMKYLFWLSSTILTRGQRH